jgi:hypothetical protein
VVTAVNAGGESAESAQVGATPLPPAPAAPALSLLSSSLKQLNFSWSAPAGATYYQLQQDPNGTGAFAQVGADIAAPTVTAALSIAVHRLNWAQARYRVRACNLGGCGDSAPVAIAPAMLAAIGYAKASNTGADDVFGYPVALSGDGNTLAVGAHLEDSAATGIGGNQADNTAAFSGAVYVFTRSGTTWSQQAYVKASNTGAFDQFGVRVALSGDGNTLAVSANFEDSAATGVTTGSPNNTITGDAAANSGAVYVFTRSGTTWSQQAYVKASNTGAGDGFGFAVALSGDGNTLAVGAHFEDSAATGINGDQTDNTATDSGAVYLFTRGGTTWSQQAYVKASNTGATDNFGWAVALSGDGNTLAVGARAEDSAATGIGGDQASNAASNSGAAYVFTRSGTTWSQQAYVKASNTGAGDEFGIAVALSGDGNTLAVGAIFEDSAATGIGGNQADNTATDSGAAYVFTRGAAWSQQAYVKASNTDAGDVFGDAAALSGDGNTLAVGARFEDSPATGIGGNQANNTATDSGAVYVFTRGGAAWSQQAYVKASNTGAADQFGWAVALSGDGNTLAVGAFSEDSPATGIGGDQADNSAQQAGAVYLY